MTSKVGFKGPLGLSVALFVLAGDPMSGAAQETLRDNRTAGRVEVQEVTTLRFHRVAVAPVLQTQVFRLPGGGWGTTSRVFGGILALFSATGSPTGTLGRHGPGPGEFENPTFAIAVGKQLWVVDPGNNRLTAFASDGTVIGDRLLPGSVFWVQPTADDRGVLLSGYFRRPSRTSNTVVWVTMDEREDRFGGDTGTSTNPWVQQDLAAATPFGEIWAVARAGGEVDILRAHNMERLASIQLPEDESQPVARPRMDNSRERPAPRVYGVMVDAAGILWIVMWVSDAHWRPGVRPPEGDMNRVFDTLILAVSTPDRAIVGAQRLDRICLPVADGLISCTNEGAQTIDISRVSLER